MEPKEIKPANITKDDEVYRKFLKLLAKVKPRRDFLRNGLTLQEIEEIIAPFYKSLSSAQKSGASRLASYNVWVRNNKAKLYQDMKKVMKDPTVVIAPDNAVKAHTLNDFVRVIFRIKKTDRLQSSVVMQKHGRIAEKLSEIGAKKNADYVKRYLKSNYKDIIKKIEDLSSDENESDAEEDAVSASVDSDEFENPSKIDKDESRISELDKQFEQMDTDDSRSNHSSRSQKIFESFSNARQSTPKASKTVRLRISLGDNDTVMGIDKATDSGKDHDSGFDTTTNRPSADIAADIRNAQGDGDVENERSALDEDADLSTEVVENKNKTEPLVETSADAIVEDYVDDDHRPTAVRVTAALSRSISSSSNISDDSDKRSSFSKRSEKESKTAKGSLQKNSLSITENQANSNSWISMSKVEYSPDVNIHGRSSKDVNTSSRSKRFKSASTSELGVSSTRAESEAETDADVENERSALDEDADLSTEGKNKNMPLIEASADAIVEDYVDDDHRPTAVRVKAARSISNSSDISDDTDNRSSLSKRSEKESKTAKRYIASINQDTNNLVLISDNKANSSWISMSKVEYSPVNKNGRTSDDSTSSRRKRFKSASTSERAVLSTSVESNSSNGPTESATVSIRNMEISFGKLPGNDNNEHVSTPARANTPPYGNSPASGQEPDRNFSGVDLQSNNQDTTWKSHKYFENSSPNIRGGYSADSERSESFYTALTRIDTNSSPRTEKSPSSVDHDGTKKSHIVKSDIFVTADECSNLSSKENSHNSHSETSDDY